MGETRACHICVPDLFRCLCARIVFVPVNKSSTTPPFSLPGSCSVRCAEGIIMELESYDGTECDENAPRGAEVDDGGAGAIDLGGGAFKTGGAGATDFGGGGNPLRDVALLPSFGRGFRGDLCLGVDAVLRGLDFGDRRGGLSFLLPTLSNLQRSNYESLPY